MDLYTVLIPMKNLGLPDEGAKSSLRNVRINQGKNILNKECFWSSNSTLFWGINFLNR